MCPQPANDMIPLAGAGSESAALKLDGFTGRVRDLVTSDCHHHHQPPLVNIDSCYLVRHQRPFRRGTAERAIINDYAPLRAHRRSSMERQCRIDWFKTCVPDQTPLRPKLIQSGYDLSRPQPWPSLLLLKPIFIHFGGPQAHGHSLKNKVIVVPRLAEAVEEALQCIGSQNEAEIFAD